MSPIAKALSILSVLALATFTVAEEEHDHEPCACLAEENGWVINCSAPLPVLAAYGVAISSNCMNDCTSTPCANNWAFVVAHHDHCAPDDLPQVIEDGFHDFETACGEGCEIARQFVPSAPQCPAVTCTNTAGLQSALTALSVGGCATTCTSSACVNNYRTLRAYHDACEGLAGLDAIHTFEEACEAAECNTITAAFNPNNCTEEHHEEEEHDHATCGCLAAQNGWYINCSQPQNVLDAFGLMTALNCESTCGSPICQNNWAITVAYHNHCAPDDLPEIVEEGFHGFETACGEGCEIGRQFMPTAPQCTAVSACNSTASLTNLTAALNILSTSSCATTCTSTTCVDAYRTLRAYHDSCEDLAGTTAIHTYEEACEAAECNTVTAAFDPNTCNGVVATTTAPLSNDAGSSSSNNDNDNTGLVVGLALACVVAVAALVLAVYFHGQKKAAEDAHGGTFMNPVASGHL